MMREEEISSLQFSCLRCGRCCSGEPGLVLFSSQDLKAMAQSKGISPEEFLARYTRNAEWQGETVLSLVETESGNCIFFIPGTGCAVYEARPLQCRSYPFWSRILSSRFSWKEESRRCPGMNQGAPADLEQIGQWIAEERREAFSLAKPE